jgi:hypothetical protein
LFRCRSLACGHILCNRETDIFYRFNKLSKMWISPRSCHRIDTTMQDVMQRDKESVEMKM